MNSQLLLQNLRVRSDYEDTGGDGDGADKEEDEDTGGDSDGADEDEDENIDFCIFM